MAGWVVVASTGTAAVAMAASAIGLPAISPDLAAATPTSLARVPGLSHHFEMLTGAVPPSPALFGAKVLGAASLSAPLHLQFFFKPTGPAELGSLATAVSTPGTAVYHHFLSVSQFAARFGPSSARVATIDRYLREEGLSVGPLSANHLAQDVGGTVGSFEHAFATPLTNLRTETGDLVVGSVLAPKLPGRLASSVSYIEGLDPWVSQSNDLVRFASHRLSGQAEAGGCSGLAGNGLSPAQLQNVYGLSGLYDSGYQGQGQTIGLIEYALADTRAVTTFEGCVGASLTVDYVPTSAPPHTTDAEVAADIEVIAALAPKATVVVYESNQQGTGLGPWELAVSGSAPGGLPEVITSSWGSCEPDTGMGSSYYQTEESIFDEAATQGQTIFVASGDDGSEGCLDQTRSKRLAVDDPATTPGVTAVGGTASNTPNGAQYIWNSRSPNPLGCLGTGCAGDGASGGGASTVWARPSYQPGSLAQSPECKLGLQGCREIPDVSALAGDAYSQYCSLSVCGSGEGWVGFGGTSLAAPSWGAA
ncbi:MAG TPA: protease pro-enzyme activation domain-containing protein, partial [Acidimicrobiales bacterium]|nr:protease pro-enzyme activation domain-containing protein [Acidimicrobiales bacterium]